MIDSEPPQHLRLDVDGSDTALQTDALHGGNSDAPWPAADAQYALARL